MYRRLIIEGKELDLPLGFSPSFSYEIDQDGNVKASSSKRSIELPATARNDEAFEDWGAISNGTPNAQNFRAFEFSNGGVTVLAGRSLLVSAPLQSDRYSFKTKSYKVDLYGNNADWFLQLKDTLLRDLPYADTIYNTAEVITGWNSVYDSGDETGFFLAKRKAWGTAGAVDIEEFTGFIFIRSLIDKALDAIGYTLKSGGFLDSDVFKRLILPTPFGETYPEEFSEDYINISAEKQDSVSSTSGGIGGYMDNLTQITQPLVGANPMDPVTGIYTVPYDGYYEIEMYALLENFTGGGVGFGANFFIEVQVNSTVGSYTTAQMGDTVLGPNGPYTTTTTLNKTANVIQLNQGDTLRVAAIISASGTLQFDYLFQFKIRGQSFVQFGGIIAWKYWLRDWKVVDLFKGLQHLFNLRFETDSRRQLLTIEPADSYLYRDATASQELRSGFYEDTNVDLTEKLDLSKDAELYNEVDTPESVILDYITADQTTTIAEGDEEVGIFAAKYSLGSDRFKNETELKENPFFAKLAAIVDSEIQQPTSSINVQIPLIYEGNYRENPNNATSYQPQKPSILYFAGLRPARDGFVNYTFLSNPYNYPYAFTVNYNDSRDFSLSFSNEQAANDEVTGLLESFWLHELVRKRLGKRLKCRLRWNDLSILNLSFKSKIFILGRLYVLSKIDGYKPLEEMATKTELTLDIEPSVQDANEIVNSDIRGILNEIE